MRLSVKCLVTHHSDSALARIERRRVCLHHLRTSIGRALKSHCDMKACPCRGSVGEDETNLHFA